ncbi:hypothetical protein JTE90_018639 [Oedothorax gibbosus]|uniref:Vitellogenin domain-containing protein n=1 Tax=Oedothorax gibbosus TaxID=931172 RepID=A0AAV6UPB1_9ARAC|nr:hypothetical protein JTE90_018639 [Oedothorax gibbosus]
MKNRSILVTCLLFFFITGKLKAEECSSTDEENVLHPGYEYSYRFESEAFAEAVGTTNDKSKISINCSVEISHASYCFYYLSLAGCIVKAGGGVPGSETSWINQEPLPDLSKYPIKFLLIGGEIAEVYTNDEDPIHFVNIKRGALSAFVFKMSYKNSSVEKMHTDIHGSCPLKTLPLDISEGTVNTTKNMLHCSFPRKRDWQYSPYSMFWNMSFVQYVINSTTDCNYNINIDERTINKVSCKERHAIMLESSHNTAVAVQTNIFYTVSFLRSNLQTQKKDYSLPRKTGIQFEYERTASPHSDDLSTFLQVAKKMLSDLVEESREEISLSTIPQFTNLVAHIRSSHNLRPFVESVKACDYLTDKIYCTQSTKDLGMSYLKDALIQCNSIPCVEAISNLARSNDISPTYLAFIYFSWSNMHFSNPAILKYIMNMCIDTDSNLCWMSMGSLIRRTYSNYKDLDVEELEKLREIARYFPNSIRENCMLGKGNPEAHIQLAKDLKVISNIGEIYLLFIPEGHNQLLECLFKPEIPVHLRVSILEVLRSINPCKDDAHCKNMYKKLSPLLMNETELTTLRALSYDYLVHIPQKYGLEGDIFSILKNDKNMQLKSYIANSLKSLMKDSQFKVKSPKFIRAMTQLLNANDLSLNRIIYSPESSSSSSLHGLFVDFPFLSNEIKRFSFKTATSKIFKTSDVIPRYFKSDSYTEVFSQLLHFFEARLYSEGMEDIAIMLRKILTDNLDSKSFSIDNILKALQVIAKEFQLGSPTFQSAYKFDESILKNIKKLEEMYKNYKPNSIPFFNLFLDLFGTTISYISSGDMVNLIPKLAEIHKLVTGLESGMEYNTTRVIRLIEAYHIVPTMMGLPLNWTTNATFAASMKSGLKVDFNEETFELHSEGFFQPSAALTFLNRMVLDFPTITQIGVQANSSGFTSTQFQAKLEYTKKKKLLSIVRPIKTQKILELYRSNQLIKHNECVELADWDIERTTSNSCADDSSSSILGFKFCLSKSYPMVTKRLKPWALMSGWCKWKLHMLPFDEKLVSYDVEVVKLPGIKNKELIMTFSTSGSTRRREIILTGNSDAFNSQIEYDLKISENPNFQISFKKIRVIENNRDLGQRILAFYTLGAHSRYEIMYDERIKQENFEESVSGPNESPKNPKTIILTKEKLLSVATPSNLYRIRQETYQENSENVKQTIFLLHETWNPNNKWLHLILPASLWENDSKAWIQFEINWKERNIRSSSIKRQTVCFIKDPGFTIELNTKLSESRGHEQLNVDLKKIERRNSKLLAFANFTYDSWSNGDKQIQLMNLTISRKSWAAKVKTAYEEGNLLCEITFNRAQMSPKDDDSNYVGWWRGDSNENFNLTEHEIKLTIDTDSQYPTRQELVDKYSLPSEDLKGLQNQLIKTKIRFDFPFSNEKEYITFDGFFVLSGGSTIFRFQNNFIMDSSYNKLQFTSYSAYRANNSAATFYHQSYITHVPSQTKSFNTIEYKRTYPKGGCIEAEFKHNIQSFFFDLSSNVSYKCNSNGEDQHTLLLALKTNSSYWSMLNTSINQIIEDKNADYRIETCNFTHPLLLINVTADWKNGMKDHKKKAIFTSRESGKTSELNFYSYSNGKLGINLKLQNDEDRLLSYERKIYSNNSKINIKLKYGNSTEEDEARGLQLSGEILNEHLQIWNAKINTDTFSKIKLLIGNGFKNVQTSIDKIVEDRHHPLNKLLEPIITVTISQYFHNLQKQRNDFLYSLWGNIKETCGNLKPFIDTPLLILQNSYNITTEIFLKSYENLKETSIIIWAVDYFNLPMYFLFGVSNLHRSFNYLVNIFVPEHSNLQIEFSTGQILAWKSFRQWPYLSYSDEKLKAWKDSSQVLLPFYGFFHQSKLGMIFGTQSVYTFDGKLYDSAEYASNCTFLLAHDLRKSQFTALSDKTSIHILFPEMTIQVNDKDEVFINGSTSPSQLPLASYNGKVVVRKSNILEIWSPSLRVICNGKHFLCALEINKWHYGGTFGLLGNADDSLSNEYSLPDGSTTANLLEFIKSYEVSGNPDCKTLRLSPKSTFSQQATETCSEKFETLCLHKKEIKDSFQETCQSEFEEDPDSCYAAAGYSTLCYFKNLPTVLNCGEMERMQRKILHRLEVVLFVHEHYSLTVAEKKTTPYKGIERLLSSLNDKFKANGYSEVLFSLIGFGGKDVHYKPTLHVKGRNIWVPLQTFVNQELKSLQFNGDKSVDALDALKFASEVVGLNTFNSKVFIILTEKDRQSKEKKDIEATQNFLENNGITLYTLSTYPTIEKGKKVFGVRADGMIFPSPKKNGTAHLAFPKGDLAKLTSATRGSVFLSKFVILNSPSSFFGEFADEVWAKVQKEPQKCRKCTKKNNMWWQDLECTIESCSA